ncbi:hypothetical protein [Amycolatopsis sp. cmx-4-68]|uniref:hypothetical protein n=1 Tax=Amycolatopsis sp. cmx-4-68 TaxID=2790938 RepID=UPI0039799D67
MTLTKARGAAADGMVLILDRKPGTATATATAGLTGRVALLLTTLRLTGPDIDAAEAVERMRRQLSQYRPLLRPGGHVPASPTPHRRGIAVAYHDTAASAAHSARTTSTVGRRARTTTSIG